MKNLLILILVLFSTTMHTPPTYGVDASLSDACKQAKGTPLPSTQAFPPAPVSLAHLDVDMEMQMLRDEIRYLHQKLDLFLKNAEENTKIGALPIGELLEDHTRILDKMNDEMYGSKASIYNSPNIIWIRNAEFNDLMNLAKLHRINEAALTIIINDEIPKHPNFNINAADKIITFQDIFHPQWESKLLNNFVRLKNIFIENISFKEIPIVLESTFLSILRDCKLSINFKLPPNNYQRGTIHFSMMIESKGKYKDYLKLLQQNIELWRDHGGNPTHFPRIIYRGEMGDKVEIYPPLPADQGKTNKLITF